MDTPVEVDALAGEIILLCANAGAHLDRASECEDLSDAREHIDEAHEWLGRVIEIAKSAVVDSEEGDNA